jgi:hypothetical protein
MGQKTIPPDEYGTYLAAWLTQMGIRDLIPHIPKGKEEPIDPKDVERYIGDAAWICTNKRLCVTVTGVLCLAPADTQEGDVLVFFLGGDTPFVLHDNEPFHTLVGPCYVQGLKPVDILWWGDGHPI